MAPPLRFSVLGPLEIVQNGSVRRLAAAKQRIMLASLLVRSNQVVPTDELIERLWDGRPPAGAKAALQVHVTRLRQALGEPQADSSRLIHTRPAVY